MELILVCLLSRSLSVFLLFPAGKISMDDHHSEGRKVRVMYQNLGVERYRCATICHGLILVGYEAGCGLRSSLALLPNTRFQQAHADPDCLVRRAI